MWMDDTEITNNEYRQFVEYVKDSIARKEHLDMVTENPDGYEILDYSDVRIGRIDWKENYQTQKEVSR